jgi:uncharacterized damage-inducible protein DinB
MTKKYFIELAKYNLWANKIVTEWLGSIEESQWNTEMISSFNSIKETTIHILSAEHIWYERLMKYAEPKWLAFDLAGDKKEVILLWLKASSNLLSFVEQMDENKLTELTYYKRINGEEFEQPTYEILGHIFNHSTYHRGQLVTMLRQTGFTQVSSTDILLYYRNI